MGGSYLGKLLLLVSLAILLALPTAATAQVTYNIGGPLEDFSTLEVLRNTGALRDNDTIVLNGDDDSLTGSLTTTMTLKGPGGVISPAAGVRFFNNNARACSKLVWTRFRHSGASRNPVK